MNIEEIRSRAMVMADIVYEMLGLIEKGFMEHKLEPLSIAMQKENEINGEEKRLTQSVFELCKSRKSQDDDKELAILEQIIVTLERMGDEAASLVERIEIKVAENLLFSEVGVTQFNETFGTMKKSVEMMRDFLKTGDPAAKARIVDNGFIVKELVERYRKEHTERLVKGVCTPIGANMYFDMLDFTGNLARHSSNIAKLF